MANQFCNSCGNSMEENATFCTNCGATKSKPVQPVQPVQQQYANSAPSYAPPVQQPYYQPAQPNYQNNNAANTQPMTVGQYILTFIIMGIPIVGFIMTLIWSFGSDVNINKKNYSRAILIMYAIGIVFTILFSAMLIPVIISLVEEMAGSYSY